jgi:hypothetical protein
MKDRGRKAIRRRSVCAAAASAFCAATAPSHAQDAGRALTGTVAAEPNPYYLGVGEAITYDSNVYRIPSGPSDVYSSTSLFGGFDQPISRQRVFGRANVSMNRYQDENRLNNTGYDLAAGADLATIENISGNVNLGLSHNLSAPSAAVGTPTAARNIADTQHADARLRWGGVSLLTVEGSAGYTRVDYSAPEYASSETRQTRGGVALYYRPGAFLRLGVGGRYDRSRQPEAVVDPATGISGSNTTTRKNVDLLAEYTYSSVLSGNARLSYTRQTNSAITGADFSGLTGSIGVTYRPGARTTVRFDASRDAGLSAETQDRYAVVQVGTGVTLTPVSALYENNRVTTSFSLGATYEVTAKIGADAKLRYSRAHLVSAAGVAAGTTADSTDVFKGATAGLTYAITRAWGASCSLGYESRDVSGAVVYSYNASTVGCSTQFVWR